MHGNQLVNHCSCGANLSWADGSTTKCYICKDGDIRDLAVDPAAHDVVALDKWVLGRFGTLVGNEKVPIIQKLPLGHAIEIVERIGALVVGGYQRKWQEITDHHRSAEEVRAIGFKTLVDDKFGAALECAYEGFLASGSDKAASLGTMYGWFCHWFNSHGGVRFSKELATAILDHATKRVQVSRLAFISLPRGRATVTLVEAARMCRVRPGTLRKVLVADNMIRSEKRKGSPVMVPLTTARQMAIDLAESLNLRTAGEVIGVGRNSLTQLARSGRLPVWMPGGSRQKHTYLFRRIDVIAWMRRLIGHPSTISEIPDDMVVIRDAPRATHFAMTALVDAIIARKIPAEAVLKGKPNLSGALVRLGAVKAYRDLIGPEREGARAALP